MARWRCPHRTVALLVLMPALVLGGCPFAALQQALSGGAPGAFEEAAATVSRRLMAKVDIKAVEALDVAAVQADLTKLLTDSQAIWPADNGHYGGLFIRLAWHCNGSYRLWDGRGGCNGARIRFYPELAWDDNTNLDKARKLLEPIKAKYGAGLSWGDLISLAGTTAIEAMGGPKMSFCLGRIDDTDGTASLELGPTPQQEAVLPCKAGNGNCQNPLGQTTMGLIYVNPEGVMGIPEPEKSVEHIRRTFGQMGMNDTETVALIGGGHAFGKTHGACPTGAGPGPLQDPKNPWPGTCGSGPMKGKGKNTFTSGFEGPWTTAPYTWDNEYFHNLLNFDWQKHKGPGGHWQWEPKFKGANAGKKDGLPNIMMLTTDIALTKDPIYLGLVKRFAANLTDLTEQFGAAWYKLMTRDMGPRTRCVGDLAGPARYWQMPLPPPPKTQPDFAKVKADILKAVAKESPVLPADKSGGKPTYAAIFANLAYRCAATYRETDYQGGCDGARIRFKPQSTWKDNVGTDKALELLKPIKAKYPNLSWADLIVLAGTAAQAQAAGAAAPDGLFAFCPGRTDASNAAGTDHLAPRTYVNASVAVRDNIKVSGFTPEEAVALKGRLRSPGQQKLLGYSGSYSSDAGRLSNEYFKILMGSDFEKSKSQGGKVEFKAKNKGDVFMTEDDLATKNDPQLAAIAKSYASDNAKFVKAFASAWTKLMNADRFKGPAGSVC